MIILMHSFHELFLSDNLANFAIPIMYCYSDFNVCSFNIYTPVQHHSHDILKVFLHNYSRSSNSS